jgi:cytochrome b561
VSVTPAAPSGAIAWGNTATRWGIVQQLFHWGVVALVLFQLVIGNFFLVFEEGKPPPPLLPLHVSCGVLIGLLMIARLFWRQRGPVPELPATLSAAQKALAHATHTLLYVLLITQFVVGYFLEDTFGARVHLFGLPLPLFVGETKGWPNLFGAIHKWIGYAIVAVIGLHVAGALAHEFFFKDNVLRRMTPLPLRDER